MIKDATDDQVKYVDAIGTVIHVVSTKIPYGKTAGEGFIVRDSKPPYENVKVTVPEGSQVGQRMPVRIEAVTGVTVLMELVTRHNWPKAVEALLTRYENLARPHEDCSEYSFLGLLKITRRCWRAFYVEAANKNGETALALTNDRATKRLLQASFVYREQDRARERRQRNEDAAKAEKLDEEKRVKDVAEFASSQVASLLKNDVARHRPLLYKAAGGYRIIGGHFKDGIRTFTLTLPEKFKSGTRKRVRSPHYPYEIQEVVLPPDKNPGEKVYLQEPTTLAAAKSSEEFIKLLAACTGDEEGNPDPAPDTKQQQQKKCDVNYIVDSAGAADDGYTVLMALVSTHDDDWDDAVKALIDAGCDVTAKSKNGETALDIAAANDLPKTVAVLLEAEATKEFGGGYANADDKMKAAAEAAAKAAVDTPPTIALDWYKCSRMANWYKYMEGAPAA
jgi:hypothetical protein